MKSTMTLTAERRVDHGKGPARQLRLNGRIPAVIYGRGREPESLTLSLTEFERTVTGHSSTTIIDLDVEGKAVKTLIREIQRHPFRPGIIHVDFYEIHEGEVLTIHVPIHLEGIPTGVRLGGGTLDQNLREIEIEVLPRHIPERVSIDVTELNIGQTLHVSDLTVENATVLTDGSITICGVAAPRTEAEPAAEAEEAEATGAEPELIRKAKEEEEGKED